MAMSALDSSVPSIVATGSGHARKPCILHLDSLRTHDSKAIHNTLQEYIMEEWRAKKKPTWDASCGASSDKVEELLRQLPPVTPSIPIQPNTWDCALYALQYAEDIFRKWPAITAKDVESGSISEFTKDMFGVDEITRKRKNMRRAIDALISEGADCIHS